VLRPLPQGDCIMGIHITGDCEDDKTAALYDSVSGFAFGPTFGTNEEANDFLQWATKRAGADLRGLSDRELTDLKREWELAADMPDENDAPDPMDETASARAERLVCEAEYRGGR